MLAGSSLRVGKGFRKFRDATAMRGASLQRETGCRSARTLRFGPGRCRQPGDALASSSATHLRCRPKDVCSRH